VLLKERLKLKVNVAKSAVARPLQRKSLGYSLTWHQKPINRHVARAPDKNCRPPHSWFSIALRRIS